MRPIFNRATNFTENYIFFCLWNCKFSSKFWKFWYQIDEIGLIFMQSFEYFENMAHVYTSFCTEWGVIVYQEADFGTHWSSTSPEIPLTLVIRTSGGTRRLFYFFYFFFVGASRGWNGFFGDPSLAKNLPPPRLQPHSSHGHNTDEYNYSQFPYACNIKELVSWRCGDRYRLNQEA